MKQTAVDYREWDRIIWEEELESFVPERVFDSHSHLFFKNLLSDDAQKKYPNAPDLNFTEMKRWYDRLFPGREAHHFFLAVPFPGTDVKAYNETVVRETEDDPLSRLSRLTTPQCRPADIERDVKEGGFIGLKPYRMYSVTGDVHQCRIRDFLPEELLEAADDLELWITMHLAGHHGCADEMNLRDLEEYTTKRFPKVRWILCHCARSFTYWPIRQAIDRLRDLPNIWYDLSAVCDVRPFITLFQKAEIHRLFYGSDLWANAYHGTYTALGRAWQLLDADTVGKFPHCDGRPILSIYEELLAIKHAAEIAELSSSDIQDIFWRNAAREFGLGWV